MFFEFFMYSCADVERTAGNSKFYGADKKNYNLEDHFFDLECQMEQNLICRDTICTDLVSEKGT